MAGGTACSLRVILYGIFFDSTHAHQTVDCMCFWGQILVILVDATFFCPTTGDPVSLML